MRRYKELYHEKNYMKSLIANTLTRLGDGVDMIAFSWLVYEVTGSPVLTASIYGINVIPNLTIGLVSGVISQYVSEKLVMAICDLGRAFCVFVIAILFMSNHLEAWHLFVITFINSSFEAFRTPCEASLYPKILSSEHLEIGLAFKQSIVSGANFLGVIIAPVCITLFGLQGALIIDAISFALCGLITLTMKHIPITTHIKITFQHCLSDLKDGFIYVKKDHLLTRCLIVFCILNALFSPINAFEAAYVKESLQMSSVGISIFSMGFMLGTILSSPFLPDIKEKYKGRTLIVYGCLLIGILFILYALLPYATMMIRYISLGIIAFLFGVSISSINFPINIALYKRVEPTYMSRVQSICGTCSMAILPIASFIAGGLSAYLSIPLIYLICGFGLFMMGIFIIFDKLFYLFNQY